jgi:hypothetical protein
MKFGLRLQAFLGFIIWIIILIVSKSGVYKPDWHILVLQLAALVWLPLVVCMYEKQSTITFQIWIKNSILFAAIGMVVALNWNNDVAKFAILPYMALSIAIMSNAIQFLALHQRSLASVTLSTAQILFPIGAAWATAHVFDFQPMGFDREIVVLTAVHFHYAGLIFPFLCGLGILHFQGKAFRWACIFAIAGVPLTAVGITTSHLFHHYLTESLAAVVVVIGGYACAIGYFLAAQKQDILIRIIWSLFGFVLIFSMTLAFAYAIRPWFSISWLTIPYMKAIHGTCNSILIPLLGLSGWWILKLRAGKFRFME